MVASLIGHDGESDFNLAEQTLLSVKCRTPHKNAKQGEDGIPATFVPPVPIAEGGNRRDRNRDARLNRAKI